MIGGLGADERVFKFLKLNSDFEILRWINPDPKEELESYANRLLKQINQDEEFWNFRC